MPREERIPFERMTVAREAANMSQKRLAEILGVDPVSVNRWEHGESRPSWEILRKISEALNVSIDYLLSNDTFDTFNAEETDIILRAAAILNKKIKKKK